MKEFNKSYVGTRPDVRRLVPSNARILLDVGCSNGALGRSLKTDLPELSVHGVDYDKEMVEVAADSLDKAWQVDLNQTSLELSFLEKYDCIIFADVLEHLVNPSNVLKYFAENHLSENGAVIISVPNASHITLITALLKCHWPSKDRGIFDRTHLRWFCKGNLIQLCEELDMSIGEIARNYRFTDEGKSRIDRQIGRIAKLMFPLREYLTYQYVVRFDR